MDLSTSEGQKYRKVWGDAQYRVVSPGLRHLESALAWMEPEPGASIADWGCGTGRAAEELDRRGFDVRLVDIAPNAYKGSLPFTQACLWELPEELGPTDYGFCADVMEHIPTAHVDDVLAEIALRTRRKCFFQIALFHDLHFTHAGPLHLSVFPTEWWLERLLKAFGRLVRVHEIARKARMRHVLVVAE